MKNYKLSLLAALVVAGLVVAGPIKAWNGTETITYTDLNSNFTHLHNSVGHGHGPVIVNADISASAAITHSKLARPGLVPKLWAIVANCTSSPCTVQEQSPANGSGGVTSVTRASTGLYTVNFAARPNSVTAPILTSTGASAGKTCSVTSYGSSSVGVGCVETVLDGGLNGLSDDGFSIMILDDDN
jgi:hypothetical protein